jgi:energy-coupling factor transporter transmembrane protein EcfT
MQDSRSDQWKLLALFIATIAAVLLVNVIHNLQVLFFMFLGTETAILVLLLTARIRLRTLLLMGAAALGPSLVQALSIGSLPILSISILGLQIHVFSEGMQLGLVTFFRVSGCMGLMTLFMRKAGISGFVKVLRQLPLPMALTEVLLFSVKFIHVFKEEGDSIRKAQKARLGYIGLNRSLHSAGHMGEAILCRAFDRSSTLAKAMRSRGGGESKGVGAYAGTGN